MKTEVSNEELYAEYIAGDKSALDKLYSKNRGLIIKKCKEAYRVCNSPRSIIFEDINQEASLAFIQCVSEFDPEKDVKFTTFIGTCVFNYMVDYITKYIRAENKECVLVERSTYFNDVDLTNIYKCESNILEQDYWQLKTGAYTLSAERVFFKNYFSETIKNAMDLLSPRQKKFISYLFGLGDENSEYDTPHTLTETANHFRLTESEVRKIEKESLGKMKKYCHSRLAYIVNMVDKTELSDSVLEEITEIYLGNSDDSLKFIDESELCEFDYTVEEDE